MRRLCAAAFVGGILLAFTSPAAAADPKPTAAQCIASFEDAQRAQKAGHVVAAHKAFAACVVAACPKQVRNDCAQGQGDTDRAIATVTVVVRDAAGADVPATIKLDGNPFTPEAGRATAIDPGPHEFEYTVNGETKTTPVTVAEGEKSRLIVLSPTPPPPVVTPPPAAPVPSEPSKVHVVGPIILGSVGVLVGVASVGVFIIASKEADEREAQRTVANDRTKSQSQRDAAVASTNSHNDAANNDQLVAVVAAVSAAVLIGAAATWYLVARPSKTTAIVPVVTPQYAGTAFSLAF